MVGETMLQQAIWEQVAAQIRSDRDPETREARIFSLPSANVPDEPQVLEFARLLIDAGADVNAVEQQLQSTPLGWAVRFGQLGLAEYFIQRGADVNAAGEDWARPLAWAQRKGHEEIAGYFLDDAIHFTPEGRRKVADDIVAFIRGLTGGR